VRKPDAPQGADAPDGLNPTRSERPLTLELALWPDCQSGVGTFLFTDIEGSTIHVKRFRERWSSAGGLSRSSSSASTVGGGAGASFSSSQAANVRSLCALRPRRGTRPDLVLDRPSS